MKLRWFFALSLGVVLLGGVGLVVWDAQAVDEAATAQAQAVAVQPPAGMSGDAVAQPVSMPSDPKQAAMVMRGEYLAVAGDCQYCHSIPGGAPYAGGQPVQSPFGDLFTPNITPDPTYGIGAYTDAQFWDVMHNGIAPGHSLLVFPKYLYPVMPWQDYNKLSYSDVMALKAYLESIQPVAAPDRGSEMGFPFTIRAGLLAWRILFFHDQPISYDPSWSPQVRNGAFLVQALAHCNECHAQRNLLMALDASRYMGGGHLLAQSWYAPDISSDKAYGVGGWSTSDLTTYLWRDGALGTGAPYGPMKAVVDDSLSRLPQSDIQDIVAYLQTADDAKSAIMPPPGAAPRSDGAQVYADNCARCHGANGEGVNNNFPNLAANMSLWDGPGDNLISMVLGGYTPWHTNQSAMPEFNQILTDDQIAAVTNYIRTSWGNKGNADATASQVAGLRGLASDWVMLDTGTTQASDGAGAFDDISGQLELFGDRENCMLNGNFAGAGQDVYIAGSCADGGGTLIGQANIGGKAYPVKLNVSQRGESGHLTQFTLTGALPAGAGNLNAQIALVSPAG